LVTLRRALITVSQRAMDGVCTLAELLVTSGWLAHLAW